MKSDSAASFRHKVLDTRSRRRRQRQGQATSAGSSCGSSSSRGRGLSKRRKPAAAFGQVQYNVYNLDDYKFVWDNYAMLHPVWVGDFGKQNMSASSNLSAQAQAKLEQVFHKEDKTLGLMLHLKLSFPDRLVQLAGAPAAAWLVLRAPPDTPQLHVTLAWQNKTVTRLPEALWLRFRPGPGAVDEESWVMKKMDSHIKPQEIIVNGSHALHAVSQGVSVLSRDHSEQLHISTLDVPLVNLGRPNPFPNPCDGPDMAHGVSFNIVNTIWGTNFAMWMHNPKDANMAFRFVLEADRMSSREGSRPQPA